MADTYNVFISWSGEQSKRVAAALYDWLPMVVQTARPWMSEEDIEKGSRGLEEIGKALESMSVGIICLTPENLERPWILFEAGALSKALGDKTRVCPYLFGDLRPENVKPPLGMFQATRAVKDDTRKLVATVNRVLGGPLGEEKLDTVFERMWPELEKKLAAISPTAAAAPPQRPEREMVAELLELSRAAAANVDWSKEALVTLLRGMTRLMDQAGPRRLLYPPTLREVLETDQMERPATEDEVRAFVDEWMRTEKGGKLARLRREVGEQKRKGSEMAKKE